MSTTPAIRFEGFADPWEQRKLEDIATRITAMSDEPDLPRVEYEDINSGQGTLNKDLTTKESAKTGIAFEPGDVLYGKLRPYLMNWLYPQFKGIAVGDFWVLRPDGVEGSFLYRFIQSERFQYNANISSGSKMPRADWAFVSEDNYSVPSSRDEQRLIGVTFQQLDNLITLHQRKHDRLVVLKKALLDKMFPRDGSRFPELRFGGFTDPWEQRKFSEVFAFLRNNTLSRAELSDSEGETRDVHYGDILVKFGEVIDVRRDVLPRIASDALASGLSCQPLSNGDVIIADTAEDEAVGKCSELRGCGDFPIVSGLHTMACRPEFEFAPGFLGYYMNSPAFHDQLLPLMQGIKVISVSKGAISDTDMSFPSLPEQHEIGTLFASFDNLITLHQRKLELLRNLKSACLDKMFV